MTKSKINLRGWVSGCLLLWGLTGCALGPDFVKPTVSLPDGFKENPGWKAATPSDDVIKGDWWTIFGDPVLDAYMRELNINNQTLKASEAAVRQARAVLDQSEAGFWPSISAQGAATRENTASTQTLRGQSSQVTAYSASAAASWELDLWGRIRRQVESSEALAQASEADLLNARLSAQAALAQNYFQLRILDETKALLDASVDAFAKSLEITRNRYAVGTAGKSDVVQAIAQLENTKSSAIAVGIQRAQFENAIAVLLGKTPSEFSLPAKPLTADVPIIPIGVPSKLLERRPDIAGLERRMASANAQIGLAITAFFPDISLTGSYGVSSTATANLFSADNAVWSFGPKVAQLIFDGGLKWNQVKAARANYDQNVANYRLTVLTAMGQVENELAALRFLAQQAEVEQAAVNAADEAERLVLNQYKAGTLAYTSVLTAQTTALSSKQTALGIRRDRLNAAILLIQGLGGGWETKISAE
jgi:NodT family efflux transporter outer membrane factor (OMF) lipoprotein